MPLTKDEVVRVAGQAIIHLADAMDSASAGGETITKDEVEDIIRGVITRLLAEYAD